MAEMGSKPPQPYVFPRPEAASDLRLPPWLDRVLDVGPRTPFRGLVGYLIVLIILTAAFAVALKLDPTPDYVGTHQQFGLPPCSFRAVFGLPCPGCGGTTAVVCLAHLKIMDAIKSSIFGAAVGVGMALAWLLCLISLVWRRPLYPRLEGQAGARVMAYTVVLMLLSWAIKIIYTLVALPGVPR
jgi:hypothetical protein